MSNPQLPLITNDVVRAINAGLITMAYKLNELQYMHHKGELNPQELALQLQAHLESTLLLVDGEMPPLPQDIANEERYYLLALTLWAAIVEDHMKKESTSS